VPNTGRSIRLILSGAESDADPPVPRRGLHMSYFDRVSFAGANHITKLLYGISVVSPKNISVSTQIRHTRPAWRMLRRFGKLMQGLLKEDEQVYKQFVENESFKRFVSDTVSNMTRGTA
jgi:hypothetical protein